MFLLQLANKVDTDVDPMRFEIDEIKTTAIIGGIEFAREINQLSKGSADLKFQHNQFNLSLPFVKVSLFAPFRSICRLRGAVACAGHDYNDR